MEHTRRLILACCAATVVALVPLGPTVARAAGNSHTVVASPSTGLRFTTHSHLRTIIVSSPPGSWTPGHTIFFVFCNDATSNQTLGCDNSASHGGTAASDGSVSPLTIDLGVGPAPGDGAYPCPPTPAQIKQGAACGIGAGDYNTGFAETGAAPVYFAAPAPKVAHDGLSLTISGTQLACGDPFTIPPVPCTGTEPFKVVARDGATVRRFSFAAPSTKNGNYGPVNITVPSAGTWAIWVVGDASHSASRRTSITV